MATKAERTPSLIRHILNRRSAASSCLGAVAAAAALALASACPAEKGPTKTNFGVDPATLRLRDVMYEMEGLAVGTIGVSLRNAARYGELRDAGSRIIELCDHEDFVGFTETKRFQSDPERFHEIRNELKKSMAEFVFATDVGDVESATAAWEVADATCIACHKRYDPTY